MADFEQASMRVTGLIAGLLLLISATPAWALNLAIETLPDNPRPGQWVQTRIMVGNPGTTTASNVGLELTYPESFNSLTNSRISDGGNCQATGFSTDCRSGEPVVWNLGDIPPGEVRSVWLMPRLATAASDGQIIDFAAQTFIGGAPDASVVHAMTVRADSVLELAMEASADPVEPGQTLVLTLHYAHRGPSATTATELRLPLPAGLSLVGADGNGALINDEVIWNLGLVNPGEISRRTATLEVESSVSPGQSLIVEQAEISGEFEFTMTSAQARSVIGVQPAGPLAVAITVGDDHARPGQPAWIQITVSNRSALALDDLRVELPYPEGLANLDNNRILDGGNCAASGFSTDCRVGEPVIWNLGTLGPGQGRTVALAPQHLSGVLDGQALIYQARARAGGAAPRWARQILRVRPGAPLRLSTAVRTDAVESGEALQLELGFGNTGGATASDGLLELPLPASVIVTEISHGGLVIGDPAGNRVVWDLGLLDPGEIGRRFVSFDTTLGGGELLLFDRARLSGTIAFIRREAHARAAVRLSDTPVLDVAITAGPNPVLNSQLSPAEIVVTNRSGGVLTGLVVELLMPEGYTTMPNNTISDGGNCAGSGFSTDCRPGEPIIWPLGNLPPGQGRTVRFQPITLSNVEAASIKRFEARIRAANGAERWSRQHLLVGNAPGLELSADAVAGVTAAGEHIDFELNFANATAQALTTAELRFPLPPGTSLVEAEGANLVDDQLVWTINLLQSGESERVRARLAVPGDLAEGRVLDTAEARLEGNLGLATASAWARTAVRTEAPGALELSIDLAPDPVHPGERLVPRLTASNRSNSVLTAVRVDLPFPDLLANLNNNLITAAGNCSGSGFSTDCRRGEPLIWELGTLPPDSGKSFWLPPMVATTAQSGRLIRLRPRVVADGQRPRHVETTVATQAGRALDLGLEFDSSPQAPGALTRVQLHFGNRTDQTITEAVLRLPLPVGLQAISADGNGIVGDTEVFWDIGSIPAGRVGQRELMVIINAGASAGALVSTLRADLGGLLGTSPVRASADGTLRVGELRPLELSLDFMPEFANAGDPLTGQLQIINRTAASMPDVEATLYFPEFLNNLANSNIPDGGNCAGSGFSNDCRAGEPVRWALGTLAPGEMRTLTIAPTITSGTNGPPDGTLIRFHATADNTTAGQADARATVLVGEFLPPPPPPLPAIALSGNGQPIANGSTSPSVANGTDFGTADIDNDPVDRVFVINNSGTGTLELTGSPRVAITGAQAAEFSVVAAPPGTIPAGGSSAFTMRFDAGNLGLRRTTVVVANNVTGQNPYMFSIQGEGQDATGELMFKDGFE